ncbi:MAG: methionyl-tRNA formyltransferase [Christensenellales bacterium]
MKVIFLGTPEFSLPTLEAIYTSKHELIAIISQPDRVQDRGNKIIFSPVKEFAIEHNIPILQFERISRDGVESIKSLEPDIMVTASYGQILSQELIDIPKYGIINVHASLLPDLRGASPIQTAVIKGLKETGVTIMRTEAGLDTGDIILSRKTFIGENETAGELSVRLAQMGAELLIQALGQIEEGTAVYTKQSHIDAVVTKRISKEEGRIVWEKTAEQIKCQILGQNPSPIAFSFLNDVCVKIYRARMVKNPNITDTKFKPGTVIEPTSVKNGLFVQCGKGVIEITELQFPGGKVLKATDVLNGRKIKLGDCFALNEEIKISDAQLLTKKGKIEIVNNNR